MINITITRWWRPIKNLPVFIDYFASQQCDHIWLLQQSQRTYLLLSWSYLVLSYLILCQIFLGIGMEIPWNFRGTSLEIPWKEMSVVSVILLIWDQHCLMMINTTMKSD